MRTADRHTVPPGDPQAGPTARPTRILPCSPGNRRPPCDQPTLQTRQPPPAHHAALPPYRPNRCRTTQAVPRKTDGCSTFTALPPPSTAKRNRGASGRARSWQESRRGGVAEGRGRGGKGLRKGGVQSEGPQPYPAGTRRESDRVFRRLCTICKPKYTF